MDSDLGVLAAIGTSRHKSLDTLRGYVRRVDPFREHAGERTVSEISPTPRIISQMLVQIH